MLQKRRHREPSEALLMLRTVVVESRFKSAAHSRARGVQASPKQANSLAPEKTSHRQTL